MPTKNGWGTTFPQCTLFLSEFGIFTAKLSIGAYNKQNYDWSETWECKALTSQELRPHSSTLISHKNERNFDNFKMSTWMKWETFDAVMRSTFITQTDTGKLSPLFLLGSRHQWTRTWCQKTLVVCCLTSDDMMNCCQLSMRMTANYDTKRLDFTTATINLLAAQQTDTRTPQFTTFAHF